ncbi:autotransporter outer membrane beta-barrel domain-containing protein [Pragia fontium]|uniref:autotransporter outer membrane beta-barrel domain-containing protein n=1 Tax=Pragia fontium TaxID=82985 RepID=UPI00069B1451|nr:autotransporter outer membrane beta-barrel domain-containing protein [Pragia fontium]
MNEKLSEKNETRLNKHSSFAGYMFIAAVAVPFSTANAIEVIGIAATQDDSTNMQQSIDNRTWSMPSGVVGHDLILNNGHRMSISADGYDENDTWIRGQLHNTKISAGSSVSLDGADAYNTEVMSATLNISSLSDGRNKKWYIAGTATDTTVSGTDAQQGILDVDYAGYANNSIINENGWMKLSFNQGWDEARGTISGLGLKAAQADNTTINHGAILSVYRGGIIKDTVVNSGGIAYLNEGASSIGSFDVYGDGFVRLSSARRYNNIGATFNAANAEHIGLHDVNSQLQLIRGQDTPGDGRYINIGQLLNNGAVTFKNVDNVTGYLQANIKELSGHGVFNMRVGGMKGDFLNITDAVNGKFIVNVADTGDELNSDSEGYYLIHGEGSANDSFTLANGAVDLGAYQYYLNQDTTNPDDWVLSTSKPKPDPEPNKKPESNEKPDPKPPISGNTYGVIALANTVPNVWDAELTTLRTRMGDIHTRNSHDGGAWGKIINSRYKSNNFVAYKQDTTGVVLGGDKSIQQDAANILVGSMMSYSRSDIDYNRGGDGHVDSYALGLYGTYLWDNGYYIDGVLKANRFSLKNNVKTVQGSRATGKDTLYGIGASIEGGRHIKLNQYFIEPYTQLSVFQAQSSDYTLSNNLKAKAEGAKSLKAELGTTLGASFESQSKTVFKPYARFAVSHEFADKNKVTINQTEDFRNDNSGTVMKYGVGVSINFNNQWSAFTELNYAKAYDGHMEMPLSEQIGVQYQF